MTVSTENVADAAEQASSEWKATVTFFLLFITVFALTLPSLTIALIITVIYNESDVPPAIHVLLVVASSILSLLVVTDPVVIMRNRDVRDITDQFSVRIAQKCCPSLPIARTATE